MGMARLKEVAPRPTPPAVASDASPSRSSSPSPSESESESDDDLQQFAVKPAAPPAPPAPTLKRKAPLAPTPHSPESEDEEEEEENHLEAAVPVPVPVPESQPSSSTKPTPAFKRIWTDDDELLLLQALFTYRDDHGKLPSSKECDAIVAQIANLVKFPVTEKHVWNKVRTLKFNHDQRMMKHSKPNATNPHQLLVFTKSAELFGGIESKKNVSSKPKNDAPIATHDATTSTRAGGFGTDGSDKAKPYFYLGELMKTATGPYVPTLDFVVENVGDSKSHDLDTKAKKLWIDTIKLHSKENKLFANLLDAVAINMVGRKN